MVQARRRDSWDHTASLSSLLANIHCNRKDHPNGFSAAEFHPLLTDHDRQTAKRQKQNRHEVKDWSLVRKAWQL
jgi:hypothetical protein